MKKNNKNKIVLMLILIIISLTFISSAMAVDSIFPNSSLTASAKSNQGGAKVPNSFNDRNYTTFWQSTAGDCEVGWFYLYNETGFVIDRYMFDSSFGAPFVVADFNLMASTGNGTWHSLDSVSGNTEQIVNRTITTNITFMYYMINYTNTGGCGGDGLAVKEFMLYNTTLIAPVYNFSLTLKNVFNNSNISNFSADIGGVVYSTNNGTIQTNISQNSTQLYNISFFNITDNGGFFNVSYNNVNISNNLIGNTSQANVTFRAYQKFTNNSLTGNITNNTYNYGFTDVVLPWNAGTFNVTFYNSSHFNKTKEFNISALSTNIINITEIYNATLNISVYNISNNYVTDFTGWISYNGFNESFNSTTGSVIVGLIGGYNYTTYAISPSYAFSELTNYKNVSMNSSSKNVNFTFYLTNSLDIYFKDEVTNVLINNTNITFDIISSIFANNYSTSNGTKFIALLDPSTYDIRYRASGYNERFYVFTLDNQTYNNITLYLLNSSSASNVTITIVDDTDSKLEGAVVKALRYDLSTNAYKLVEIGTTNYNGETIMSLALNSEYYKFMVEYPDGTLRLTTEPSYITSTSITIPISLSTAPGQDYYNYLNLAYDLSFNPSTDNFRLNFNDANGVSNGVCLYVYSINYLGKTLYNSSCSSSASATLLISVDNTTGRFYTAEAYWLNTEDTELFLASLNYEYDSPAPSSDTGLFLQILLSLVMTILSLNSGLAPVVLPISIVLGGFMGLHSLPLVVTLIMVVVGIVIMILVSKPRG